MISQRAVNYALVLDALKPDGEKVGAAKKLLLGCRELMEVLESPVIRKKEKETVIDEVFDRDTARFLKLLCENQAAGLFEEIMEAYEGIVLEHNNVLKAGLAYAVKPEEGQLKEIKAMLREKYKKSDVFLELEEDASLIGGYVLSVGDTEYDKSIKGALSEMQKTLIGR